MFTMLTQGPLVRCNDSVIGFAFVLMTKTCYSTKMKTRLGSTFNSFALRGAQLFTHLKIEGRLTDGLLRYLVRCWTRKAWAAPLNGSWRFWLSPYRIYCALLHLCLSSLRLIRASEGGCLTICARAKRGMRWVENLLKPLRIKATSLFIFVPHAINLTGN